MGRTAWRRVVFGLLVSCFVTLGATSTRLLAQVVKGSISGTVVDTTGATVPDAAVKVVEASTGATSSTVTATNGQFHLPLLAIGSYTLTVTKQGFRSIELTNVGVNSAQDTSLGELKMEVGAAATSIEVTAAPPLVEATQSQISASIAASTITEFPGVGENEGLDFLALQVPGVVSSRDNNFANTNGMGFSSNGLRGRSNDQQIDGQNNNDNSVTGPQLFMGNPDFVQEYQLTTNNFGPEYGRNAGAVVNIITKSGTNHWHGDVFGTEGNNKLNTLSNTQKAFEGLTSLPVGNTEFSGASIGGPIIKDKWFIFGGFDNQINPGSSVDATGNLTPDPTGIGELQACFPNTPSIAALASYGPFGVKGGNPIISGTPETKTVTVGATNCQVEFSGVQRTLDTSFHQWDDMERIDYNGDKDKVYGRFIWQKTSNPNVDEGQAAEGYPVDVPGFAEDWGLSWTRTLSSTMFNEARLSYGRSTAEFGGNTIGNTVPPQTNLGSALSSITMPSGYAGFGPSSSFPQGRIVNTYQFQDNWNWIHGRHEIKAGTNLTYQRSPNVFLPNYNATFNFKTFSQFAADTPNSISVTLGSPILDFREHDSFFYAGDDFKLRPNLTLNLGLTYTYFGQPANLFNKNDAKQQSSSEPFWNPSLPTSVTQFPALPAPKNGFGPSVGFAYTPDWGGPIFGGSGKTVLRGGYRLSYDPPFYNIYLNMASSAPQVLAQTLTGANAAANPLLAQPLGSAARSELASYLTLGVKDPRSFNQTQVSPDFRGDHVQSWSFGIERQLGAHAVLESRYVGNHGSNLFQSINGNPLIANLASEYPGAIPSGITPCAAANAAVPTAVGRENCNEGVIRERTNTARSDYNGWQTELRTTNLWNQLTLRTSYTWSKTTDNTSEIFGSATNAGTGGGNTIAFAQDPLNYISAEHSLSGLDIPQNWTLSFQEQIPAFRNQHGLVGHVLGGWAVTGSYILSSGQPYTPIQFGLNSGSGGDVWDAPFDETYVGLLETARPFAGSPSAPVANVGIYAGDACAYAGAGCSLPANTLLNFNQINTTGAVATTSASNVRVIVNGTAADGIYGTPFGSMGRNTLRDAGTNIANFAVYKYIKVTESVKVRFDTSFINLFNHPNFSSVDPYLDDAGILSEETGFGVPSLWPGTGFSNGQRQIQFGLRIEF